MIRPQFIARQSGNPSGLIGRIVARVMASETAELNQYAVSLLDPKPGEKALDIGTGDGVALGHLAARVGTGEVVGVDHSAVMCKRAAQRNHRYVSDGRVRVERASTDCLPFDDGWFDAALSVHTLYFWNPAKPHLLEIARVLRPGGRLVLGFRVDTDPAAADFPSSIYTFRSSGEVKALLSACEFECIESNIESSMELLLCIRR